MGLKTEYKSATGKDWKPPAQDKKGGKDDCQFNQCESYLFIHIPFQVHRYCQTLPPPLTYHPFSLIRSNYVIAGSTLYRGRKIENDDVSFEDNFISIKYTIQLSLAMHFKRYLTSKWRQIDTYVTVIDLKIKYIWVMLMLLRCELSINTVLWHTEY